MTGDDDSTDDVERYLVRHGALARRRLVGSIRPLGLARGDRLLIRTERGIEAAETLLGPAELPASLRDRRPTGEALGPLDPASHGARDAGLEQRVRGLLESRAPEAVLVDSEWLWEGRDLILYLAFDGTPELGRIAAESSTDAVRVRFETHRRAEDESVERFGLEAASILSPPTVDRRPREERFKDANDALIGELPQVLAAPERKISYENGWRLQHHGMYVQRRRERTSGSESPRATVAAQEIMLRVRVPGGRLATSQFVALLDLAERHGRAELRLTSRQTVQIHGIAPTAMIDAQRALAAAGLSSWATCGDTVRNVVACPALPRRASFGAAIRRATVELDRLLRPREEAYERLWSDDPSREAASDEIDSLFGRDLLPRKFKVALATPDDCCTDVRAHDLGFRAIVEGERLAGWTVWIGGGLGYAPGRDDTTPRLAEPLGRIAPDAVLAVARSVLLWYRREGNREDRRRARLKYLVADLGVEAVREKLSSDFDVSFDSPGPASPATPDDHLDLATQDDGRRRFGLFLASGRIGGPSGTNAKALVEILRRRRPALAITPGQDLLFLDVAPDEADSLREELITAGLEPTPSDRLRRRATACPALPTCGLALAEGERLLPEVMRLCRTALDDAGLADPGVDLSLTGCPNGCARAYLAEFSLVGVGPGRYAVRIGGTTLRDRLNVEVAVVTRERLAEVAVAVARWWRERRAGEESFGATILRAGAEELAARLRTLEPDSN